jgi:hypothetical protein
MRSLVVVFSVVCNFSCHEYTFGVHYHTAVERHNTEQMCRLINDGFNIVTT